MDNALIIALIITAIGMTLLFLALTFFYGLLSLATRLFRERERAPAPTGEVGEPDEPEAALLAAALAVSLARAEGEALPKGGADMEEHPSAWPSAWWTLHQQRNRNLGPSAWRAR